MNTILRPTSFNRTSGLNPAEQLYSARGSQGSGFKTDAADPFYLDTDDWQSEVIFILYGA